MRGQAATLKIVEAAHTTYSPADLEDGIPISFVRQGVYALYCPSWAVAPFCVHGMLCFARSRRCCGAVWSGMGARLPPITSCLSLPSLPPLRQSRCRTYRFPCQPRFGR